MNTMYHIILAPLLVHKAALNPFGPVQRTPPERNPKPVSSSLASTTSNVDEMASVRGRQVLILGAWGCGVMGHKPSDMVELWCEALDGLYCKDNEYSILLEGLGFDIESEGLGRGGVAWDEIHFAVPAYKSKDAQNVKKFKAQLEEFCGAKEGQWQKLNLHDTDDHH